MTKYRFNEETLTYQPEKQDKYFKKLLNNTGFQWFLAILAIAGGIIGIYSFFQEKKVNLQYEILSNINVLDFNADLSKLEVFYDSTNLKQTEEELRIVTVKITNTGEENILKASFDENDLIGIKILNGAIIEKPELIKASSDYIRNNLKLQLENQHNIKFSTLIIENNEYFIIKILLLHKKNKIPELKSVGKIAGQKEILVLNVSDKNEKKSILKETYGGNIWAQILRSLTYPSAVALIVILASFISDKITSSKKIRRRRKQVEKYMEVANKEEISMMKLVFEKYIEVGVFSFKGMINLLEQPKVLNDLYKEWNEFISTGNLGEDHNLAIMKNDIINDLIRFGFIYKSTDGLIVNKLMHNAFQNFFNFLEAENEIPSYFKDVPYSRK